MSEHIMVLTTVDDEEQAQRLAQQLVKMSLAACVQVLGPISSHYHWKGEVERTSEWLCLVKTRDEIYGKVEQAIREHHPYEVPEIVAVPIVKGSRDYLQWLDESLEGSQAEGTG
jgi:periplasmic divalent cation tolerance protein